MSLWKKTEYRLAGDESPTNANVVFTGIIQNDTTVIMTVNPVVLTEFFNVGDIIGVEIAGVMENLTVTSVDDEVMIATKASAEFSGHLYILNVPTFIKDPSLKSIISYVDYDEATSDAFREIGVKSPGWVTSFTYQDQNGKTRNKNETLVVVKGKAGQ